MPVFHNAPTSHFTNSLRPGMALAIAAAIAVGSGSALAADVTISAGGSSTASRIRTPAIYLDVAGARRPVAGFAWQPVASLGVVGARDERADLDRTVAIAGAGIRLVDWWKRAFYSFQIGYASRETAALSSHGQFISSLGWEGERTLWTVRHISNGNVYGGKNLGETMLLVGVRF